MRDQVFQIQIRLLAENYLVEEDSPPMTRPKTRLSELESKHQICTIPKKNGKAGGKCSYIVNIVVHGQDISVPVMLQKACVLTALVGIFWMMLIHEIEE
jgi:hypothetical protein